MTRLDPVHPPHAGPTRLFRWALPESEIAQTLSAFSEGGRAARTPSAACDEPPDYVTLLTVTGPDAEKNYAA